MVSWKPHGKIFKKEIVFHGVNPQRWGKMKRPKVLTGLAKIDQFHFFYVPRTLPLDSQ